MSHKKLDDVDKESMISVSETNQQLEADQVITLNSSSQDQSRYNYQQNKYQRPLPQILTRNTILPNLSTLDAGDVIECYALMRNAKLANTGNRDNNIYNQKFLSVRKSAIAFRYKPKPSSPDAVIKSPFELTLEYGPQRTGATQSFEAMPSVMGTSNGNDHVADGTFVSWENHGK